MQQAFAFRKFRPKAVLRPRGPREAARLHAGDPEFVRPAEEYERRMQRKPIERPVEPEHRGLTDRLAGVLARADPFPYWQ